MMLFFQRLAWLGMVAMLRVRACRLGCCCCGLGGRSRSWGGIFRLGMLACILLLVARLTCLLSVPGLWRSLWKLGFSQARRIVCSFLLRPDLSQFLFKL